MFIVEDLRYRGVDNKNAWAYDYCYWHKIALGEEASEAYKRSSREFIKLIKRK